jgi:hypothetical protein
MTESAEAEKIAWEAITEMQADRKIPSWILQNATSNKSQCDNGLWKVEVFLFKKRKLKPGESWQRKDDGSKMLVHVDQDTGEKRYVLTYTVDDSELINLFEAEVDVTSKQATIKNVIDLTYLKQEEFEVFYE